MCLPLSHMLCKKLNRGGLILCRIFSLSRATGVQGLNCTLSKSEVKKHFLSSFFVIKNGQHTINSQHAVLLELIDYWSAI